MEYLIFDTTFLIDFQRERKVAPREAWVLKAHADAVACLLITAYGEFAESHGSRIPLCSGIL